jgi:hypothetical protein
MTTSRRRRQVQTRFGEHVAVTAGDYRGERTLVNLLKHGVVGVGRDAGTLGEAETA